MLAAWAEQTERIEIGTAVVPTYPRHPTALAQQALTAGVACRGRFTLGIGLSHAVMMEKLMGLSYARRARHMREYIEDLPYTGEVMGLSLDDWQSWSTREQIGFLHRLEEKVSYYRALHDHTDLWVSLDGGPVGGDSVYPVPLEMLP